MTQTPLLHGCNAGQHEAPGHHPTIWVPPSAEVVSSEHSHRIDSLTSLARWMADQLSEQQTISPTTTVDLEVVRVPVFLASTPRNSKQQRRNLDPPGCHRSTVVRWIQGTILFVLVLGTFHLFRKGLPTIDLSTNTVVQRSEEDEGQEIFLAGTLFLLWLIFLVGVRLTCKYSFPPAGEEQTV